MEDAVRDQPWTAGLPALGRSSRWPSEVAVARDLVSPFSATEQAAVLGGTADLWYALDRTESSWRSLDPAPREPGSSRHRTRSPGRTTR